MEIAAKEFLQSQEGLYEKRRDEILGAKDELKITGTAYYVSNNGDDLNDGMSPEKAWKTVDRVNGTWLLPGDGVFFKRGDLWRAARVKTKSGVTYGAYGEGEKPRFYGWIEDLANTELWEPVDEQHNIWKYVKPITDVGTLVFNAGEKHSRKLIPSYRNLKFVCRDDETRDFVMANEMTKNLDIFWKYDAVLEYGESKGEKFPVPKMYGEGIEGDLYLRCDEGNPGDVFDSIEAVARYTAFSVSGSENVTIDNICMKYLLFGVQGGGVSVDGLHVSNCEIAWIGGNIQHYAGTDPNYPQGTRGSVTRFGNGIEVYGGCKDYEVKNCYIYESYDAGITHQVNTSQKRTMTNVRYTDNLIEKCVYGIEYFLDQRDGESESYMDDIEISGNIIRLSGYGWGQQRHNTDTPALIKGWSYINTSRNYSVHNNVFDRSAYRMLHLVAKKDEYCPEMYDNTYIQDMGGMIGQYGGNEVKEPEIEIFDDNAEDKIKNVFCEKNPKVYIIK